MLELGLPFCVRAERMTGLCFALGLDGEHFSRVIENGGGRFALARHFRIRE